MVEALRSTVPVPESVPAAPSNRPVPPVMVPVKLTPQVVLQAGSSAEPPKCTRSRSPFAAVNVAVPENVPAAKFTQCGYVAVSRPRWEPVPVNVSVIGTPSQGLGFPGVTSKVPAYLKVIGPLTAAAGTANSATHSNVAASVINRETVDVAFPPRTLFLVGPQHVMLPSSSVAHVPDVRLDYPAAAAVHVCTQPGHDLGGAAGHPGASVSAEIARSSATNDSDKSWL